MKTARLRILLCLLFLVIISLVLLAINYRRTNRITPLLPAIELPPTAPVAIGTPLPPVEIATPAEAPATAAEAPTPQTPASFVGQLHLVIPVAGVRPEQLLDTFSDARSEGRTHDAIDIMAPANTPVLAAAGGKIVKLYQSERGGVTIYQISADQELIFYYAHLSHYAPGLTEGANVRQGEVIAYVGDTGNAGTGNYHLHFSIAAVADPKRYWEGTSINPFPLLQNRAR